MKIYHAILGILIVNLLVFSGLEFWDSSAMEPEATVSLKWKVFEGLHNGLSYIYQPLGETGEIIVVSVMFDRVDKFWAMDQGYTRSDGHFNVKFDGTDIYISNIDNDTYNVNDHYRMLVFYK